MQDAIIHRDLKRLILEIDSKETDEQRVQLLESYRANVPEFNEFILKMLATIGTLDNLTVDKDGNLLSTAAATATTASQDSDDLTRTIVKKSLKDWL
eukprot:gene16101-19158_t